jgi:LD-carboxypeptidase C-terminal domain/Creatinine amidohydrolase
VVLLPAIPHGYDPHHMDFPGAVTIGWDTFTRFCADVGRSLAHHGFRRMLFLNGHGSNQNLVEMAARLVMVERPEVLAAAAVIERVRDSSRGGMAHACELLQTMGTPWEVELAGGVLFFEDVEAPPWYVDGMLTQLGQAGKPAQVVGVAIGEMDKCDWSEQRPGWPRTKSLEQVLEEHLEPLGVPVPYKLPVGHAKHLATLPLGVTASLDADARTLTVDEPALR